MKIFSYCTYLIRAVYVVRTVILVDDNWVLDIFHNSILETYVSHEAIARPGPRLDSQSILSSSKYNRFNNHILYSWLLKFLSQAPNTAQKRTR